jgi:hypothetical protein
MALVFPASPVLVSAQTIRFATAPMATDDNIARLSCLQAVQLLVETETDAACLLLPMPNPLWP